MSVARWYDRLDSGQPWFLFWISNTLDLLGSTKHQLTPPQKDSIIAYLKACQHPAGGFAGSPYMEAHAASSYAAVMTIANLHCEEAYAIVDRKRMLEYLGRLKHNKDTPLYSPAECSKARTTSSGSFEIHHNGENDLRATYCSLVVADVLNLLSEPALRAGIGDFIAQCQTYEGGIACVPFGEAHAGYTYCGLASLILLQETDKIDVFKLLEWAVNRKLTSEGGFNGRIHKLVDSCYNFWVGAIAELVDLVLQGVGNYKGEWLYNQYAVQGYTLLCCQTKKGGLIDKPEKSVDLYHTCYSLCGASIAQSMSLYKQLYVDRDFSGKNDFSHSALLANDPSSKLSRVHPLYNVQHEKIAAAKAYYATHKP